MVMFLVLSGLGLIIAMQIAIVIVASKHSVLHALLCFVIPFYVYVYGRKQPEAKPFIWLWYLGVALLGGSAIANA